MEVLNNLLTPNQFLQNPTEFPKMFINRQKIKIYISLCQQQYYCIRAEPCLFRSGIEMYSTGEHSSKNAPRLTPRRCTYRSSIPGTQTPSVAAPLPSPAAPAFTPPPPPSVSCELLPGEIMHRAEMGSEKTGSADHIKTVNYLDSWSWS